MTMDLSVNWAMLPKQLRLFPWSILSVCLCTCQAKLTSHERTKRHLNFPTGAALTVSVGISTFLPKDVLPEKVPAGFAQIIEYDFGYPLPHDPALLRDKNAMNKKKKLSSNKERIWYGPNNMKRVYSYKTANKSKWKLKRRIRALDDMSAFLTHRGHDGPSCIARLSCEVHGYLKGDNLLEELLLALVPMEDRAVCDSANQECAISPLSYIMHSVPVDEL